MSFSSPEGNRGLGFEVCRQLAERGMQVWAGSRDLERGEAAAARLADAAAVRAVALDVQREETIAVAAERVGAVDVLVNNAGILLRDDTDDPADVPQAVLAQTMDVNCFGVQRVTRAFLPAMNDRGSGRVINVSSGCGRMSTMHPSGCTAASRLSRLRSTR